MELFTDAEARDSILDDPLLTRAILSQNGHLAISPQFFFYILTRHVLKNAGLEDRQLCDYLASLLDQFSRTARLGGPGGDQAAQRGVIYLSDLLMALREASPAQAFLLRTHVGNYSLFLDRHVPRERRAPQPPGRAGLLVLRGDGPRRATAPSPATRRRATGA